MYPPILTRQDSPVGSRPSICLLRNFAETHPLNYSDRMLLFVLLIKTTDEASSLASLADFTSAYLLNQSLDFETIRGDGCPVKMQ